MELVELVVLLQGQQFGFVELLQTLADRLEHLGVLPPAVVGAQPAEHLRAARSQLRRKRRGRARGGARGCGRSYPCMLPPTPLSAARLAPAVSVSKRSSRPTGAGRRRFPSRRPLPARAYRGETARGADGGGSALSARREAFKGWPCRKWAGAGSRNSWQRRPFCPANEAAPGGAMLRRCAEAERGCGCTVRRGPSALPPFYPALKQALCVRARQGAGLLLHDNALDCDRKAGG